MEDCDTSHTADIVTDIPVSEVLLSQLTSAFHHADDFFQLQSKWQLAQLFATEHPIVTVFAVALFFMSIFPVFCFLAFAICLTFILVSSCLFFEGLFLSLGVMVLLGVITFLGFISLAITCIVAFAYYGLVIVQSLVNNAKSRFSSSDRLYNKTD